MRDRRKMRCSVMGHTHYRHQLLSVRLQEPSFDRVQHYNQLRTHVGFSRTIPVCWLLGCTFDLKKYTVILTLETGS